LSRCGRVGKTTSWTPSGRVRTGGLPCGTRPPASGETWVRRRLSDSDVASLRWSSNTTGAAHTPSRPGAPTRRMAPIGISPPARPGRLAEQVVMVGDDPQLGRVGRWAWGPGRTPRGIVHTRPETSASAPTPEREAGRTAAGTSPGRRVLTSTRCVSERTRRGARQLVDSGRRHPFRQGRRHVRLARANVADQTACREAWSSRDDYRAEWWPPGCPTCGRRPNLTLPGARGRCHSERAWSRGRPGASAHARDGGGRRYCRTRGNRASQLARLCQPRCIGARGTHDIAMCMRREGRVPIG